MNRPKELDVPHWAIEHVKNKRAVHVIPARVTDRMIYARLIEWPTLEQFPDKSRRAQDRMFDQMGDEVEE